jgi:hypothetical protein
LHGEGSVVMQTAAAELYLRQVCVWPTTFYQQQHWRAGFRCYACNITDDIYAVCEHLSVLFRVTSTAAVTMSSGIPDLLRLTARRMRQSTACRDMLWWAVEQTYGFVAVPHHARCAHTSFPKNTVQYSLGLFLQLNWLLHRLVGH